MTRPMVFSCAFGIAYIIAYYFDLGLFTYYPAEYAIIFAPTPRPAGQAVLWYGWLATGVLAGGAISFLMPRRVASRLPAELLWLLPVALMLAVLFYEKRWFL